MIGRDAKRLTKSVLFQRPAKARVHSGSAMFLIRATVIRRRPHVYFRWPPACMVNKRDG